MKFAEPGPVTREEQERALAALREQPPSADILEAIRLCSSWLDLERALAAARADYLAVCQAVGIVYQADGHNDEPGPLVDVLQAIKENAQLRAEAERAKRLLRGYSTVCVCKNPRNPYFGASCDLCLSTAAILGPPESRPAQEEVR